MRKINYKFRGVNSPTNVLAFPSELKGRNKVNNLIGDIAICFELLKKEAEEGLVEKFLKVLGWSP